MISIHINIHNYIQIHTQKTTKKHIFNQSKQRFKFVIKSFQGTDNKSYGIKFQRKTAGAHKKELSIDEGSVEI